MEDITLIENLADCTASCGWCVHQCKDEDKYEMLFICINIQREYMSVCRTVNLILGDNGSDFMKRIMEIF